MQAKQPQEPLVVPAAALILGILAAGCYPIGPLLPLVGALLCFLLFAWFAPRIAWPAVMFMAGAVTAQWHAPGSPPVIEADPYELMTLEGCVVEPSVLSPGREQFTLELDREARARVTLNLRDDAEQPPKLAYGQRVQVDGRIRAPRNFGNPGAFDMAAYLARSHIYWYASAPAGTGVKVLPGRCGSRFWAAVYGLRVAALERIEQLYAGDDYSTAMMQAILIGETAKLEKVWTEHFRRSGTYHALVISGLHLTVLAGTLLLLLRVAWIPVTARMLTAGTAAWVYALVSGWQAPVVRAAGGFTLYLLARYTFRPGRLLNLLCAVAIPLLLFDPRAIYDVSFQLSFLSVAVIGALVAPISDRIGRPVRKMVGHLSRADFDSDVPDWAITFRVEARLFLESVAGRWGLRADRVLAAGGALLRSLVWAAESVLLSAFMQVGLALPMIYYFHRFSWTGLSANLLIVPIMNGLIPLGFLAVFTNWRWLGAMTTAMLHLAERIAAWHVRYEPNYRMPDPPWWLAAAFCLALLAVAVARRFRWLAPAMAALAVVFALLVWAPFGPPPAANGLELTMIDVGQGESLYLGMPDGSRLLIDGGGLPVFGTQRRNAPRMDIGEDVVSRYLWRRGIRRLDAVAMTHAHADHSSGLLAVIENFRPRELWTGATVEDSPDWIPVRDKAREFGVRIVPWKRGDGRRFGTALIRALAPAPDYETRGKTHNNDSLVLAARYGARSFLLTGDIEKSIERDLIERSGLLTGFDVLKAPHHGSRTSSTEEFVRGVRPAFALISAGFANVYRLPSEAVLERYGELGTGVLRTDRDGLITVWTDGRRLSVETWRTGLREEIFSRR